MVIRRSRRSIWGVFGALALVLWLATSRNFVPFRCRVPSPSLTFQRQVRFRLE